MRALRAWITVKAVWASTQRALSLLCLVASIALVGPSVAVAGVVESVMSVTLPNITGQDVAQIRFLIMSPGIGALADQVAIGPANRLDFKVSFVGRDLVQVVINPLQVVKSGQMVTFSVSVPTVNGAGVLIAVTCVPVTVTVRVAVTLTGVLAVEPSAVSG